MSWLSQSPWFWTVVRRRHDLQLSFQKRSPWVSLAFEHNDHQWLWWSLSPEQLSSTFRRIQKREDWVFGLAGKIKPPILPANAIGSTGFTDLSRRKVHDLKGGSPTTPQELCELMNLYVTAQGQKLSAVGQRVGICHSIPSLPTPPVSRKESCPGASPSATLSPAKQDFYCLCKFCVLGHIWLFNQGTTWCKRFNLGFLHVT